MSDKMRGYSFIGNKTERSQPGFIPQLEGARGIAALTVAIFHTLQPVDGRELSLLSVWDVDTGQQVAMKLLMVPFNGLAAVSFFFVLSGFVLARSLSRGGLGVAAAASFAAARVKRIYPVYAISTVVFVLAYDCAHQFLPELPTFGVRDTVVNLAMVDFSFKINGPLWSAALELIVTPLIFLAAIASRQGRGTLVGLLLMTLVGLLLIPHFLARPLPVPSVLYLVSWLARFSFMFVLGALIANTHLSGLSQSRAKITFAIAAGCLLVPRLLFAYDAVLTLVLEAVASATLITLLASGPSGLAIHFLLTPPIRLLGRISYSFYAFHILAPTLISHLLVTSFPTAWHYSPFLSSLILVSLSIPVSLCLAVGSYRLIEKPMTHLRLKFAR